MAHRIVIVYALAGIAFGMLFPLVATLLELIWRELPLTLESIRTVHTYNRLLLIIDTAPFFLGLFSLFNGVKQAELMTVNSKLEQQVFVDSLTRINNRHFGMRMAAELIAKAENGQTKVGFIFFDIDRFKVINDTMGHWVGDQLLIRVAESLSQLTQPGEFLMRLGGDEFLVLVGGVKDEQEVDAIARRYLGFFQQPVVVEEKSFHVSTSIGISLYPDHGGSIGELFRAADVAMYENKRSGAGGYTFFGQEMLDKINEEFLIERELRQAIEKGELYLAYQPILQLQTKEIVAVEALLRWNNATLGEVYPGRFIPIAERSNLIVDIGAWVLQTACRQLKDWQGKGLPVVDLAINVSANQLIYPDFVRTVQHVLAQTELEGNFLKLEITESISISNIQQVQNIFRDIKKLRVRLSIDDFGTGYSSLAALHSMDVDEIKVDKSFVESLHEVGKVNHLAIIEAVLAIAQKMDMQVVAEGVETAAQAEILTRIGCHQAQGFLYSHPLRADEMETWLESRRKTA